MGWFYFISLGSPPQQTCLCETVMMRSCGVLGCSSGGGPICGLRGRGSKSAAIWGGRGDGLRVRCREGGAASHKREFIVMSRFRVSFE